MRQSLHLLIAMLSCLALHSAFADKTPIQSSGGVYVVMPDQLRAIFDKGSIIVQGDRENESWKLSPAESHNHFGLQLSSPMSSDQQSSGSTWSAIHKILIDEPEAKIIVVLDDDYTPYVDPRDKESKRGYAGIAFIYCDGSDSRKLPGRAFMKLKLSGDSSADQDEPEPKESSTSSTSSQSTSVTTPADVKKQKDQPNEKEPAKQKDKDASSKTGDKAKKDKSASSTPSTPKANNALANSLLTGTTDKKSVLGALRGNKK